MTPTQLAALHAAAFDSPRPWSAAEFAAILAGAGTFLVAEDQGFLVGRAVAGEAELLTIAVPPARRRRGSGRRLLARFEAEAAGRGAAAAHIEVAADNTAALGLYRAAGWQETGRRRAYYPRAGSAAVDALILSKPLPAA